MDFSTVVNKCERYPKALERKRNGALGALTTMNFADYTIFDCPDCQSKRASIIASSPPQAKCSDCGHIYDIATFPPADEPPNTLTLQTKAMIHNDADELIRAHKEAARLSAKFGEEIESQ